MALLLGEDGNGLELARKLESQGVWRSWLGESLYSNFKHCLSTPPSWDSFMRTDEAKSRVQIQLQLRVRALLFDKATLSLFLRVPSSAAATSHIISKLNPNYLQLHGDDVYFTLEEVQQRDSSVAANTTPSKVHAKAAVGIGTRYGESEIDSMSQRFSEEDFPETWYSQFFEKHRASKPYVLSSFSLDSEKRSPSEMFNYVRHLEKHKRRRVAFKGDPSAGFGNLNSENRSNVQLGSVLDGEASDEETFFPETMFMNCVPDIAIVPSSAREEKQEVEFFGVLDKLPQVATKSSILIERLGISMDQGPGPTRNKVASEGNRRRLSNDQALLISKKVVVRSLAAMGFEGTSEVPVEVFSQLLSCHICKLGSMLKVLADSYRKKCSAFELIRMFLQVSGHGNLASLAQYIKDGRNVVQQSPQQVQNVPSQLPITNPNALHMPQVPRPMQSQMQQIMHPQNLTLQQQQHFARMRRAAQLSSPRPGMNMDKDRPLVEVKVENTDIPLDNNNNAISMMNSRQQHMHHIRQQLQQQQLQPQQQQQQQLVAPMQRVQAQYRQLSSLHMAQMQTTNVGVPRAPPVKVEGFQELMGGDSSFKHDSDEGKLMSPK